MFMGDVWNVLDQLWLGGLQFLSYPYYLGEQTAVTRVDIGRLWHNYNKKGKNVLFCNRTITMGIG